MTPLEFVIQTTPRNPPLFDSARAAGLLDSVTRLPITIRPYTDWDSVLDYIGCLVERPELLEGMNHRPKSYSYLTSYTGLGYSEFAIAVARRSLPDVERLAANLPTSELKCNPRDDTFGAVELALGWPEGLSVLTSLDLCPLNAMTVAACAKDATSLQILFKTKRPVFARPGRICAHCVGVFDHEMWLFGLTDDLLITQTITDELVVRRQALNEVAIQVLHPWERESFGLSSSQMLGQQSAAVCEALVVREKLPYWLEGCGTASPYHVLARTLKAFPQRRQCLQILFTAGFQAIDTKDENNCTPLQLRVMEHKTRVNGYEKDDAAWLIGDTLWFLQHGARPIFDDGLNADSECWPTVLFYLLGCLVMMFWNEMEAAPLVSLVPSTSIYPIRDGCQCFCSDGGCVAPSMIWRRSHLPFFKHLGSTSYLYRGWMLEKFCSTWELNNKHIHSVLGDFCRVELFHRLGMTHTCCARAPRRGNLGPPSTGEKERMGIQEDEAEFAAQLEIFMVEYEQAHTCFVGDIKEFWGLWWWVVDAILPPLTVEEANQHYMSRMCVRERRHKRELEALYRGGYDPGAPFVDIIRNHFSKLRKVFSEVVLLGNWEGNEHPERNYAVPAPNGTDGHLFHKGRPGPWPVEDSKSSITGRFISHSCCCGRYHVCKSICCGGNCSRSDPDFSLGSCCCVEEET